MGHDSSQQIPLLATVGKLARGAARRLAYDSRRALVSAAAELLGVDLLGAAYYRLGILRWQDLTVSGELRLLKEVLTPYLRSIGRIPVLFDVGANVGDYAMTLRQHWPEAAIHAFEPNPTPFEAAQTKTANASIALHQMGMAAETGTATLFLPQADEASALGTLHQAVLTDLHKLDDPRSVPIELSSIDDFCQSNGIDYIDLLKIDTEGTELEVLKGATRMLANSRIGMIQFEFNEMNVCSRIFLRDYYELLDGFTFYRLSEDRLVPLGTYSPRHEIFQFQNILAIEKESHRRLLQLGVVWPCPT